VLARRAAAVVVAAGLLAACSGDDAPSSAPMATSAEAPARGWRVVDLDGRPAAAAVTIDGLLGVVDDQLGELQLVPIDPTQAGFDPQPIGGQLVGVSFSDEADWAIDATGTAIHLGAEPLGVDLGGTLVDIVQVGGNAYVADLEGQRVVELDARTGEQRRTFAVPDGVVRLAAAGDLLWATGSDQTVTPIDLGGGEVGDPVEVGAGPIGLAVSDGVLWVANGDDGSLSRLDAATGARRGNDIRVGSAPIAVAVDHDDVWVLNQDSATVSHLSAATGERVEPDLPLPVSMTRGRDLVATSLGVAVIGVDASQAAFLPPR
jgi:outer membrane protein assembly factor BamB